MPSIELQSDNHTPTTTVDINKVVHKWLLNPEQQQAFRIITDHSPHRHKDLLKMFILGTAGTGKMTVINAVKDFFEQRGQTMWVYPYPCLALMTLHSLLCLNTKKSTKLNAKSHYDLLAMWEGVDYLFINEVSMISHQFLC
ncbi:hypothetical protein L208DRAFT_1249381 [Tricholoma matsutake]|nr:hypothetical protein L208DRAFT_1249381 [Tricholoma matsutake 945]